MAFDESLALRVRNLISPYGKDILEKRMFGGLTFLYKGKISVGIVKDELVVRYIESEHPDLLLNPNVRPMDFTKKPMKEFVYVGQDAFSNDSELFEWIKMGIAHAESKS